MTAGSTRTLHWPAGTLERGPWAVDLSAEVAGWSWSSLRVLVLAPGESQEIDTAEEELLVVPLSGSCALSCGGETIVLEGRTSPFAGVTDFAYLPRRTSSRLHSREGGRFALPGSSCAADLPLRYVPATEVSIELRGAGTCSRQVHNFATPDRFDADRLIACEVLTPAGNWSSFPPHKHDQTRPGESELEEIYYFEVADGPSGPGVAYQRVYGTPERPIELLAEVRSGDAVLIPHGWHGPSMAVPGYDLYYLNVMAGPGERAWLICDDPAHAWVRTTWTDQPVDPRLPFKSAAGES